MMVLTLECNTYSTFTMDVMITHARTHARTHTHTHTHTQTTVDIDIAFKLMKTTRKERTHIIEII